MDVFLFWRYIKNDFTLYYPLTLVLAVVGGPSIPGQLSGRPHAYSQKITPPVLLPLNFPVHSSLWWIPCGWVHWLEGVCVGGDLGFPKVRSNSDTPLICSWILTRRKKAHHCSFVKSCRWHGSSWLPMGRWLHSWELSPTFTLSPGWFFLLGCYAVEGN